MNGVAANKSSDLKSLTQELLCGVNFMLHNLYGRTDSYGTFLLELNPMRLFEIFVKV